MARHRSGFQSNLGHLKLFQEHESKYKPLLECPITHHGCQWQCDKVLGTPLIRYDKRIAPTSEPCQHCLLKSKTDKQTDRQTDRQTVTDSGDGVGVCFLPFAMCETEKRVESYGKSLIGLLGKKARGSGFENEHTEG